MLKTIFIFRIWIPKFHVVILLLDICWYLCVYFSHHAGTTIITTAVYWSTALVFMLMDYTQMPSFLMKYKIQEGKNAPPPTGKVIKVCTMYILGVKVRNMKMDFNTGGTWRQVGQ